MIFVHYLFISCGCAKIPQNFKPSNPFVNPELFNCTRIIAVYKVIALTPFILFAMMVVSCLMGVYLELYTKQLLIQHSSNMKAVVSMQGCFDEYVNADIDHLVSVYSTYNNQFDQSLTHFAIDVTQYVLAGISFINLTLTLYFLCRLKSMALI
jgi:hypothetical protein